MQRLSAFSYEFVEFIPSDLKHGVVYISIPYTTASHNCACGCGRKVVTPLTPTDWKLIFDGDTVSLSPSIGNWSFECRSHYWILCNRVKWARRWIKEEVDEARAIDRNLKLAYFEEHSGEINRDSQEDKASGAGANISWKSLMSRFNRLLRF